jgi:hypothetical protein
MTANRSERGYSDSLIGPSAAARGKGRLLAAGELRGGISLYECEGRFARFRKPAQRCRNLVSRKIFARVRNARGKFRNDTVAGGGRDAMNVVGDCFEKQAKCRIDFRLLTSLTMIRSRTHWSKVVNRCGTRMTRY